MNISKGRVERQAERQKYRVTLFKRTYNIVMVGFILGLTAVGLSIAMLYVQTMHWGSQQIQGMATLDAEYVSDHPETEFEALIEMSSKLNKALSHIEEQKTRPNGLDALVSEAEEIIKSNELKTGNIVSNTSRLKMYQTYFNFMDDITTLDVQAIRDISAQVNTAIVEHNRDVDKHIIGELTKVVEKYSALNAAITQLQRYGTINGDTYTIYLTVNELDSAIEALESVSEFPQTKPIIAVMKKNKQSIIDNNQAHVEQSLYHEFKALTEKLDGLYVQVSDIKTYADVQKNGWVLPGDYKSDEKVREIRYNGSRLSSSDWIRIDTTPTIIMERPIEETTTTTTTTTTSTSDETSTRESESFTYGTSTSTTPRTETIIPPIQTTETVTTRTNP